MWTNLLNIIGLIAAGAQTFVASGAGGEKDREHVALAINVIGSLIQAHNAAHATPPDLPTLPPAAP